MLLLSMAMMVGNLIGTCLSIHFPYIFQWSNMSAIKTTLFEPAVALYANAPHAARRLQQKEYLPIEII